MPEILYALAVLACPVGMGAMMWVMMRGSNDRSGVVDARQAELTSMRAEIDQLRAAQDSSIGGAHTR